MFSDFRTGFIFNPRRGKRLVTRRVCSSTLLLRIFIPKVTFNYKMRSIALFGRYRFLYWYILYWIISKNSCTVNLQSYKNILISRRHCRAPPLWFASSGRVFWRVIFIGEGNIIHYRLPSSIQRLTWHLSSVTASLRVLFRSVCLC